MPKLLALEWDQRSVRAVEAELGRNGPRALHALNWHWPEQIDPLEAPEEAGSLLREQLDQRGIRAREVLVALGRNEVVLRRLQLPPVPDEELPALVRLQAEMKVSAALEQLMLDFLPLPWSAEDDQREVLLVETPREKVEAIQAVLAAAGRETRQVSITPVALTELLQRASDAETAPADQGQLVVWPAQGRFELSVFTGPHLLFAHAVPAAHEENEELLLAEIQRTLGAVLRSDPGLAIARVWLVAGPGEYDSLRKRLPERMRWPVEMLDPLETLRWQVPGEQTGQRAAWAGAVGLLWGAAQPLAQGVDFLHPRREPEPRNHRRQRLLAAGAAAAVVLGGLFGWVQYQAAGLEQQLRLVQQDLSQLQQALKQSQHVPKHAQMVEQWARTRVDWLEQVHRLARLLQEQQPREIYLTQFRVLPVSGSAAGPVARVQGSGYAASRREVQRLYQRLAEEGYRVHPRAILPDTDQQRFPWRFELDLEVLPAGKPRGGSSPPARQAGATSGS